MDDSQFHDTRSLAFRVTVDDDWPPVRVECLPFAPAGAGLRLLTSPLFVKGLSVADVVAVTAEEDGQVLQWRMVAPSRSKWLLPRWMPSWRR